MTIGSDKKQKQLVRQTYISLSKSSILNKYFELI